MNERNNSALFKGESINRSGDCEEGDESFYKIWATIDKYDDAKLRFMRINSRQILSESWPSG